MGKGVLFMPSGAARRSFPFPLFCSCSLSLFSPPPLTHGAKVYNTMGASRTLLPASACQKIAQDRTADVGLQDLEQINEGSWPRHFVVPCNRVPNVNAPGEREASAKVKLPREEARRSNKSRFVNTCARSNSSPRATDSLSHPAEAPNHADSRISSGTIFMGRPPPAPYHIVHMHT